MKAGIARCQLTEDMCPGRTDFKVVKEGTLGFEETGQIRRLSTGLTEILP